MEEAIKKKLRKIPKRRCAECNKVKSYVNPIAKCFECKKYFCYDHIFQEQVKDDMRPSDQLRGVCKRCQKKFGYHYY